MKMDSPVLRSPASDDSFSDSSSASSSSTLASSDYSESSCTSASGSSRVHAASLVDPARHSPELLQLLDSEVSPRVVDYIVDCVADTVASAMGHPASPAPSSSASTKRAFTSFVRTLHSRAEVALPTILTALVYVSRARPFLSIALPQYALERVWLGALIAASKYTQDSTLKNVHWALCTGVFGVGDIGRIEREFLGVLDWELGVGEGAVVRVAEALGAWEGATERAQEAKSEVPRGRTGKPRTHVPIPVPALEPSTDSSPASSVASVSPRTPASVTASSSPVSLSYTLDLASPLPHAAPSVKASSATPHPASHRVFYPARKQNSKPPRSGFKLHALLRAAAWHAPRRVGVH
ncbi:hypothetical protein FB451DRAFT_1562336 [Mycena latifolia]|nr:hypothetical protein FB451DRAFT_1562336 [Mycena latifolia]